MLGPRREHLERLVEPASAVQHDVERDHDHQTDRPEGEQDILQDAPRIGDDGLGGGTGEVRQRVELFLEQRLKIDGEHDVEAANELVDLSDEGRRTRDELRDLLGQLDDLLDRRRDDQDDQVGHDREQRHVDEQDGDGPGHVRDAHQAVDDLDQQRADEVCEEEDEEQVAQEGP